MTKEELLNALAECDIQSQDYDEEIAHKDADAFLLDYINDPEITAAFHSIKKWYA